jgi:hypothetical protein
MPTYTPPLRDMQFVMHEVLKVRDEFKTMPKHAEVDADTINAVLEEAGKFASEVIFPLNISGDTEGCTLDKTSHEVKTPKGFKEAYKTSTWKAAGPALSCDPAYGGQGLPLVVNQCLYEMMNSANQAWTMYPGLTHGAYAALHTTAPTSRSRLYLPKMTSGEWTGTMCLTEPHCGTDLGLMRTKAEPRPTAPTRSPATRSSSAPVSTTWPPTSSTWCWPACPMRPRASRASACSSCPSSWSMPTAALGARNPASTAVAWSTRWASTPTPRRRS